MNTEPTIQPFIANIERDQLAMTLAERYARAALDALEHGNVHNAAMLLAEAADQANISVSHGLNRSAVLTNAEFERRLGR